MKPAINHFSILRHIALPWLALLLVAASLLGCRSYGPIGTPDFDPAYSRTLEKNERLLFSAPTGLMAGTYMEGEEELFPVHKGVLLLTNERMMFASWDEKQQRYEPQVWTSYQYIAQIKKHNNILLQYLAIVATDGSKFSYMLNQKTVEQAHEILLKQIRKNHNDPKPSGPAI